VDISRTSCVHASCTEPVWFRRLCKAHHRAKHPDEKIREYCFRWELVEEFTGAVRSDSRENALDMVKRGVIKGRKEVSASNIPLPSRIECVKEMEID